MLPHASVVLFAGLIWLMAASASDAGQDSVHTLTGRVLTPEKQPALGAAVTLLLYNGQSWQSRHANTDADGVFRFEQVPGTAGTKEYPIVQVLVQKPGSGSSLVCYPEFPSNVEVHLYRPVQMAVRVAGSDGKPIVGLKLRIRWLEWPDRPPSVMDLPELDGGNLSVCTDQDGRAVFEDLPAGAQVLLAHPDEHLAQFGWGSWIMLGDGSKVDVGTLTLASAATISGTVRYAGPEARLAAGVTVHAQPRDLTSGAGNADTQTDGEGHFTFRQMAAASYDLHCYLDEETQREWTSPPRGSMVAAGQTLAEQNLTLTHGALITGKVTAAGTGKGVAGIPMGTEPRPETSPGGNVFSESGPDGSYSLRVVPGGQHVYIAADTLEGYTLPDRHAVDTEVKEGETLTLDFALSPVAADGFVSGWVVDSHDQPVAGAEIYLCVLGRWQRPMPQKSDAQGRFHLRVPEAGLQEGRSKSQSPREVRLFARTEAGQVTVEGVNAEGGTQDIVLKLADHAMAQVSGRVHDEAGHAMGNLPVRASASLGDLPGSNRVVRTDAQGGFVFDGLLPGVAYSFGTEVKGYTRGWSSEVALTAGERRQLPDWQLEPARLSLAGKVVDASGKPVAGATLYPQALRVDQRGTTSDTNGDFRLEGLAEEWMWVSVNYNTPTVTMVRVKTGDQQVLVELPTPREGGSRGEDNRTEHFAAMIGKPAPAVQAATWINAPALPAEQWRGKVVMVDFWAVTCGPCIGALPEEQKFWEAYQARDLVMVGLHNTGPALEVEEFLQKQGLKLTFPLAMDSKHGSTASAYGVVGLPAYAVIDREGSIAYLGHQWEQARQKATDLLDKHP